MNLKPAFISTYKKLAAKCSNITWCLRTEKFIVYHEFYLPTPALTQCLKPLNLIFNPTTFSHILQKLDPLQKHKQL